MISLFTVSFLGALDHTVVATSLATIAGDLGAVEQMSWVIVSYTLASTVVLPVLGKLADLIGARFIFLSSLVLFLIASLLCGFAQDMTQLALARIGQGVGSAGLHLMPQTIIGEVTSPRERPRVLSIIGVAFPVAILVGPLAGGLITDAWGWRWVFWINIPVGLIALALAVVAVPHIAGRSGRRFDIAGALTLGVTVTALVLAASWVSGGATGSGTAVVVAALVAIIGLVAFIAIELRVAEPLVPLRHFADRTILLTIILSTVIGVGLFSVVSYVPTYIQMAYRTSATVSGLVPIATVFGMLVATLLTGWLSSRSGRYRVFPIFGTATAAVGLLIMALLPAGMPLWVPDGRDGSRRHRHGLVHEHHRRGRAERGIPCRYGERHRDPEPGSPGRIDHRHRDRRRADRRRSRRRTAGGSRCDGAHAAGGVGGVGRRADRGRRALLERARTDLPGARGRVRGRSRRRGAAAERSALG